jgi:hypothetical protein
MPIKKKRCKVADDFEQYLRDPGYPQTSRYGAIYRLKKITDTRYWFDMEKANYVRHGQKDGDPKTIVMVDPEGGPCFFIGSVILLAAFDGKPQYIKIESFDIKGNKTFFNVKKIRAPKRSNSPEL